jgi:hypothetical protein
VIGKFSDQATYLFDLSKDPGEKNNLLDKQPGIAKKLAARLAAWNTELCPPHPGSPQEFAVYNHYFNLPMPEEPKK